MDRNSSLVKGFGVLAAFAAGVAVGRSAARRDKAAHRPSSRNRTVQPGGLRSVETDDMVEQFRRQEDAVRRAIVQLTMSLGTPGADQIGLAGRISGMAAELTRIESRRQRAEADAAAIPFPGPAKVDALRTAVGALEAAISQGLAGQQLIEKTTAAIEAWKA